MLIPKAKISVPVLLLVALYTFLAAPLSPLFAQEGLEIPPPAEEGVDQTPPVITHTPPREPIPPGESLELTAVGIEEAPASKGLVLKTEITAEKPWYQKWWVWAIAGGVVILLATAGGGGGGGGGPSTGDIVIDQPLP